jgi:hypothetical protein
VELVIYLKRKNNDIRMVSISTGICSNLNGIQNSFFDLTSAHRSILILVTSGRVYRGFKGNGWLKMINPWRLQDIVKMVIVLTTSPDIRRGYKIQPDTTTPKSGQISLNIHNKTTRI